MKLHCPCGAVILDIADSVANKAHLIPDQRWLALLEEIDGVIEDVAGHPARAEAACMKVRRLLTTRLVYQCRECGRLFVDDGANDTHEFLPATGETGREILGA